MVNVENVAATKTLAVIYDLLECINMPPLVEDKPAVTVDEEGGWTSGEQEIRMLPMEKAHWEYQPCISAPKLLPVIVLDIMMPLGTLKFYCPGRWRAVLRIL